jgi:type IV pilus assembly protein PilB
MPASVGATANPRQRGLRACRYNQDEIDPQRGETADMGTGWAAGGAPGGRRRLGEVLVTGKVLTEEQLNEALRVQREDKGRRRRLGEVITALGLADEVQIARALSDQLGLPFLDLGSLPIPDETLAVLPRNVALRHGAVPVTLAHDVLTVALADPTNVLALDDIRLATKVGSVRTAVATASDLREAVNRYYGGGSVSGDTFGTLADVEGLEATEEREEDLEQVADVDDAPVVRLVNAIMGEALHSRASDIHIEPEERNVRVRFRIDGLLREVTVVPKPIQGPLISRVKILSGMDISERRKPQDGRGRIRMDRQEADTRVSSMPTMHGETVVIRLLRKETEKAKTLAEVGLDERDRVVLERALAEPQGLILITGPTGSGKTSSLYAGLATVIRPDINVVTLEDPVEYQMAGVNQVQINERVGLTFAGGLRTILRQDPDIVMVGEIRDPETAAIAMQASMTGHLVLSTLHTNDAPSAVSRLIDMGVEPFLITSSLTLVVGQRLARVPCPRCSEPVEADPKTLELLGLEPEAVEGANLRSGTGCGFCAQTGYQGRVGLFEVVRVTRKLRELIVSRATEVAIKEEAAASGMRSMRADGLAKALAGRTTLEEVLRVTPPDPDLARRAGRRAGGPAPAQVASGVKTPPKVLVLDDDAAIVQVAAAVLVDGYAVMGASEVDEALRMVAAQRPDLLLVDLDLPGADPTQLLAALRETAARDLPVLLMSAVDDRRARDRALAAGATGFIPKPFGDTELRSEVAAVLRRRPALVDHPA